MKCKINLLYNPNRTFLIEGFCYEVSDRRFLKLKKKVYKQMLKRRLQRKSKSLKIHKVYRRMWMK